jgi:hypothetical protein
MGFRFRRSVKILPGIRLNFGKRGISTSVGVRGAHVTFGRTGTRTTVGLPGSGISYTHLENPRHGVALPGGAGQPTDPGAQQGSALRGFMWIGMFVVVVLYAVGHSTNPGPSPPMPATQAPVQAAQFSKVAEVKMAALGVARIRRSLANSRSLRLSRVELMPNGTICYQFQLQNSRGVSYRRTAVMDGAVQFQARMASPRFGLTAALTKTTVWTSRPM